MNFSWSKLFFYMMIILGIIGLISLLATNPVMLLTRILIGGAVIGVIIFIYKVVTGQSKSQNAGYKRAVQQSKKRKKERTSVHASRSTHLQVIQSRALIKKKPKEKHNQHQHLTVIEGKKKHKRNSSLN